MSTSKQRICPYIVNKHYRSFSTLFFIYKRSFIDHPSISIGIYTVCVVDRTNIDRTIGLSSGRDDRWQYSRKQNPFYLNRCTHTIEQIIKLVWFLDESCRNPKTTTTTTTNCCSMNITGTIVTFPGESTRIV